MPSARNDILQGNPKLKALNPKQIPISKLKAQDCFGHLDFGHSILFRISDLGLGICMLLSLRGTRFPVLLGTSSAISGKEWGNRGLTEG